MHLRLHLPSSSDMPGTSLLQQKRLQQVIAQSLERVVTMFNLAHVQIELTRAETKSSADHIHLESFPEVAVLQDEEGSYIYAGGCPYVEANNLAHALEWGASLFGRSGYAVLQAEGTDRFYAVRLNSAFSKPGGALNLVAHSFSGRPAIDRQPEQASTYAPDTLPAGDGQIFFRNQEPIIVALIDGDGQAFFRNRADQSAMNPAGVRSSTTDERESMVDFIVMMDRSLFAEMPWEKRVEYLLLLIHAWTSEREENAIQEIIYGTRTIAELEALFALLRERGKHALLFNDLDERTYNLLQLFAEFVDDHQLDWRYLVSLLLDMKMLSATSLLTQPDPLHELQEVAHRLYACLQDGRADSALMTPSANSKARLYEGSHELPLAEFLWIVEKARQGNPRAQEFVTRMVIHAGAGSIQALLGLDYVEELTQPGAMERDNHHEKEMGVSGTLRKQLWTLLLFDLLAWFTDSLASGSVEDLPQRLAVLMDEMSAWRPQGIDIAGVESGISQRLMLCMTSAGGMTALMMKGLRALQRYTAWDQATMLDLIENIPADRLQVFLRTMTFASPSSLQKWEVPDLKELATHPAALAFIREAGSELMQAIFERLGGSWVPFESFLRRLAVKKEYIHNPIEYQWFLCRLGKGDVAAFPEVTDLDI